MKPLNRESGVPLYMQIRESIREEILKGKFNQGQQISPENDLAEQYGVSRLTVRQGLEGLMNDGIIYKERGVGTFVSRSSVQANYSRLTSFTRDVIDQGKSPSSKLLDIETCTDRTDIQLKTDLPLGTSFYCIHRVRLVDSQPVAIQHSYVPQDISPKNLEQYDWSTQSLFNLMETDGIIAKSAIEKISACLVDERHSEHLDLALGEPLIYIERITYGQKGTPIEYVEMYNRPDRYDCVVHLTK